MLLPQICSLLRGGIAERGGVRVGHRIIEINNQSVVAVPHEKIVNLLATSVGEVTTKMHKVKQLSEINFVFYILDSHENNANVYVPAADGSRESHLYLNSLVFNPHSKAKPKK